MDKQFMNKLKGLVGQTIVKIEYLSPKDSKKFYGWNYQPCEIHLSNGVILTPSCDDEGNNAGAIFTNIDGLATIPVERNLLKQKANNRKER
jgi:hypothetical protein|tara:strand:- start:809 stop:1081 length:273 start_codon:yes stop_codon:yes gene_type:complete